MAVTIKLKNGSGSDPGTSDLVVGEVAVRTDNGKLFTKKDDGTIAEISGSGGGGGISDGDKGDITVSNSGATFTIDDGVVTSAKIADGTIVNADISGSAAIAGSKIQAAGLVNAGVMTAAQHNKLAGIEANATADMTGSEILSTISGENIILGEISSTGNSSFAGNMTISSSDGGSAAAPELDLYRISASPADADYLGQIKFSGESDDDSKEVYAKITGKIGDASSGTEDGIIEIAHRKAGSNNISARFTSDTLKLINGTGLEVDGNISCDGGQVTISGSAPKILLTDTNDDPDYQLKNFNGVFELDQGTSDTKFKITTDGHVEFPNDDQEIRIGQGSDLRLFHDGSNSIINDAGQGNLQIQNAGTTILGVTSSGINVTGAIIVSSTVDGRDLATDGSKLDGIESGATADQTKSDIDALGIAASTATTLATARTIAGVSFDGSANISLNNNAITNGAGYLTSVGTSNIDDGAVTNAKVNASAAIAGTKIDPNFGTQNVNTSGSVACGNITISNVNPKIFFTDTNNDSDFSIKNNNGVFSFTDQTNSADRFTIASDGTVDVAGNLDVGAGIDVTGDAAVSGSVTAPRISGSNGILEVKQEIGTSQTLTSGYNAIAVDPTIANGVTITVPSGAIWSIV